jgi:hypothetical protein
LLSYRSHLLSYGWINKLVSLSLANNSLTPAAVDVIVELLNHPACVLQELNIGGNLLCGSRLNNGFSPEPMFRLSASLAAMNRSLTSLDLSSCDIGARSTMMLMTALTENTKISTLNLSSCNISGFGASHIGEKLPLIKGLTSLNISDNNIGLVGCVDLFTGLKSNSSLTKLDVSDNESLMGSIVNDSFIYDAQGMTAIANCVAENKTLCFLNLARTRLFGLTTVKISSYEEFRADAMEELAVAILRNLTLQEFILTGNRMAGCMANCKWLLGEYGRVNVSMNLPHLCSRCPGSIALTQLINARKHHPRLGLMRKLIENQRTIRCIHDDVGYYRGSLADQTMPEVAITCLEIDSHPSLEYAMFNIVYYDPAIVKTISDSISKHYFLKTCTCILLRRDEQYDSNSPIIRIEEVDIAMRQAKRESFERRILLAEFIRSCQSRGAGKVLPVLVLEYLFGEQEAVTEHYKRYI